MTTSVANKPGNVTLATLAERLNVTTTTVSKALRGKPGISETTVNKVRALAQELNYQPNVAARNLKKNATDSIGLLITSDIVNPWYAQLVSSIECELAKHGKTMVLSLGKDDYEKERHCLEAFGGGRVAGVIVGPIFRKRNLQNIWQSLNHGLSMVMFNCMDHMPVDYVAVDQAEGARLAVNHLIENGHRRIGYLCCPPSDVEETGKTRRQGFEQALFDHDLPVFGRDIVLAENTKQGGYEAMKAILAEPRDNLPTAFFCHNDTVALGAMLAIQQAGLSVPKDISLIGFDDIEESALAFPPLTTMGNIKGRLAEELVRTLLESIDGTGPGHRVQKDIAPELIVRHSVRNLA